MSVPVLVLQPLGAGVLVGIQLPALVVWLDVALAAVLAGLALLILRLGSVVLLLAVAPAATAPSASAFHLL